MGKGLTRSNKKGAGLEIKRIALGSPAAISATAVKTAVTLGASALTGQTSDITSPDVPRNVTVKGNAGGIAGNVVVYGTDFAGNTISETIALNGSTEVAGNKGFATVTSYDMPAKTNGSGDTVSIGLGNKLALPFKLAYDTILNAFLAGARESTRPTVAVSSSNLYGNTVALNSSLNGTAVVVDLYTLN